MRVSQEPDRVSPRAIVSIAVVTALVTAGGVLGAWLLQRSGERAIGVDASEPTAARWGHPPEERNAIETSLFGSRGAPLREPKAHGRAPETASHTSAERLHAYGWRDRQLGTVFIPLDTAMHLYLDRAARTGGRSQPNAPGNSPRPSAPQGTAP
jgi:hypothetical protein